MEKRKLKGWAASSNNPEEFATTIKGLVASLSGVIIFIAAQFLGITLNANDISDLASLLAVSGGAIVTLYGAFFKILNIFARE